MQEFKSALMRLKSQTSHYLGKPGGDALRASQVQKLTRELEDVRGNVAALKEELEGKKKRGSLSPQDNQSAQRFLRCHARLMDVIQALLRHSRDMTSCYEGRATGNPRKSWGQVIVADKAYLGCTG